VAAAEGEGADGPPIPGVRQTARRLLSAVLGIARTRWEIVVLELEAERRRLVRLWLLASLTGWLAFSCLALTVTALLLWADPSQRVLIAAALAAAFALLAVLAGCLWARLALRGRRPRRSSP
jgi:uncharacterized membrane protein YqjE